MATRRVDITLYKVENGLVSVEHKIVEKNFEEVEEVEKKYR